MKKSLLLGLGAVAMAFAAGATLTLDANSPELKVEEVDASSSSTVFRGQSGDILYVKANQSTYFPGGYLCTLHLWGGNSETPADNDIYVSNDGGYSAYTSGDSYLPVRIPFDSNGNSVTYTSLQICRKNGGGSGYLDYTNEITISDVTSQSTNVISYTGYGGTNYSFSSGSTYTHYGIKSGDHIYLTLQYAGENWGSADAKYALNFWGSDTYSGAAWTQSYNSTHASLSNSFMWQVEGQGDTYGDKLYEAIVPQLNGADVIWNGVKAYRFNTAAGTGDLSTTSGMIWNKGSDHYFNSSIASRNVIQKGGSDWENDTQIEIQIADSARADMYGTYFLSQVTCNDSGSITGESGYWNNVSNEYNQHLSNAVRDIIFNKEGVKSGGSNLETAVYRYDYIVLYKKPLDEPKYAINTDFIDRGNSPHKTTIFGAANIPFVMSEGGIKTEIMAAILVSSIAVVSISTYLFMHRKKEQ